jgi:hypothetical protein
MDKVDKYTRHIEICKELNALYKAKNIAYGNSFGKTFEELGIISAITRMSDKMQRIKALATGAQNNITDECIQDTLEDLANYCIMTLIELENERGIYNDKEKV